MKLTQQVPACPSATRLKGASLRTSHPHSSLKTHTCHQELLVPVLRRSSWQLFYTLALAGCVKQTRGPGPASPFLRGMALGTVKLFQTTKSFTVGFLGNRALVCASCDPPGRAHMPCLHQLSTLLLQCPQGQLHPSHHHMHPPDYPTQ